MLAAALAVVNQLWCRFGKPSCSVPTYAYLPICRWRRRSSELTGRFRRRECRRFYNFVRSVISTLELHHLQHCRIGNVDTQGVAPDVRKKVTIAVELVMNPSLLFLDEPTTGLDSASAFAVMTAVRKLVSILSVLRSFSERTHPQARSISVICTVHQPSQEIVSMYSCA